VCMCVCFVCVLRPQYDCRFHLFLSFNVIGPSAVSSFTMAWELMWPIVLNVISYCNPRMSVKAHVGNRLTVFRNRHSA
jgi:hypothetical protein